MQDQSVLINHLIQEGQDFCRSCPGNEESRVKAFERFLEAADLGSVEAMVWCGEAYLNGYGTNVNQRMAERLIRQAVKFDNPRAKYLQADQLIKKASPKLHGSAFALALEAWNAGEQEAFFLVGWMYLRGVGTAKDTDYGYSIIKKAAKAGDSNAIRFLDKTDKNKVP